MHLKKDGGQNMKKMMKRNGSLAVMPALFLLLLFILPGFNTFAESSVQVSYEPFEPFATPEPDYQQLDQEDITYSILEDGTISIKL